MSLVERRIENLRKAAERIEIELPYTDEELNILSNWEDIRRHFWDNGAIIEETISYETQEYVLTIKLLSGGVIVLGD